MIPKGGFGQEGKSPFGLFRKAAELLEKTGRAQPRIAKHAEKREELYAEEVAPGIYVKVNGLTQSGKLVEGDRRYEFDVFDVCEVDDDKLIFASDDQGAIRENTSETMGQRLASSFGNELYPLIMDAMVYQGVDTLDRMSVIEYLRNIGESRWADYLMDEIDDGQWTDIVSDLINSTPDDFMSVAAYQGTGQWIAPGRPEGREKGYPEEFGSDEADFGLEDGDEDEEKENGEKLASKDFAQGYEYGSGADARELSAREIAEMWPEVNPDEFAQGMLDGLTGDTFRTDLQTGQSDLLKDASVEWEEEKSYQLGYEYGSAPGAERMDTAQISAYLSYDVLDAKPNAEGLFNMIGNVSAFQKGMNDALNGQSKKIDEMTGQGDMFRGGKNAGQIEDARLGEAGNRILSAFRDGTDMQPTERNPSGFEGFPPNIEKDEIYTALMWTPEEIDVDIERGVELGYWDDNGRTLHYKGGSKKVADEWSNEDMDEDSLRENAMSDEDNGPTSEDIVMYPSGSLGGKTGVSEVEGKFLGEFETDEEAEAFIKRYMQQSNWYPDVWYRDDHGGYTLRTLSASKRAGYEKELWMAARVQNLLASGEARSRAHAEQIAAQQWDEQSQFAEEFEHQQGGPMGYRDTGKGYNAPMQIDPSAESHIGKLAGDGNFEEIPLDEWKGMMPDMGLSNEEIAQDFAEEMNAHPVDDVGGRLKGFLRQNYPQQLAEFNAILGIYNRLSGGKTAGSSEDDEKEKQILRDAFQTGDPREFSPTPGYDKSILKYTGCSPDEVGYVEWLMRGERPTLDSLDSQQFSQLAQESYELYKYVMRKTEKTASGETWIVVNANDLAAAERALAEGGFAGEKSRFVKQSGDSIVFALNTVGKTSDDIWRAMFGISWSFYNADSFGMSTYDKQAIRNTAGEFGKTHDTDPLGEYKTQIAPLANEFAAAFGLTVTDVYVGSSGANIELSGFIPNGREDEARAKAEELFGNNFVEIEYIGPIHDHDAHATIVLNEKRGQKLIVREASGETNEQIAGAWHEFMISDRGQTIGSPLAGLKLFVQYNYPDKLNEYEQIAEIYSSTQWPSSLEEGYPSALYPAD